MASALLGLSCTMPSEMSGTPVAPLNWHASARSSSMNGCGVLPDSCPMFTGAPSAPEVSASMRDSWYLLLFSITASNCLSVRFVIHSFAML